MSRDWEKERPKKKAIRACGNTTTVGYLKPYNELLDALSEVSALLSDDDRKVLRKLAWGLGMNGETHACEAIMIAAAEKRMIPTPWGYMTEEQWKQCGGHGFRGI